MRKAIVVAVLVCFVVFLAGTITSVVAQGVSSFAQANIITAQNNLDSRLASMRAESDKLMAKISQLNAKINILYSKKSPNQKKISAYRKKITEYQKKLWQNIQKENDLRAKASQTVKQSSDLQQAVAGDVR